MSKKDTYICLQQILRGTKTKTKPISCANFLTLSPFTSPLGKSSAPKELTRLKKKKSNGQFLKNEEMDTRRKETRTRGKNEDKSSGSREGKRLCGL